MEACMAFDFLPGGSFTINSYQNFDRSIPHYFMMVPTIHVLRVYKRETLSPAPIIPQLVIPVLTSCSIEVKTHKKSRRQREKVAFQVANVTEETIIMVSHIRSHQFRTLKIVLMGTSRVEGSLTFPHGVAGERRAKFQGT
ncbi:hypothetical protein ACLOJK_027560 [Asimina triloba]